jgi:NAD(P)-dependent dehydrogenase (short-subunit alcohol dehydrogenase family)
MRLKDKTAIITGAASGIGKETAVFFAREGAGLALLDLDAEAGKAAAASLSGEGADARFYQVDVTDESQVEQALADADSAFSGIDILVNSAGIDIVKSIEATSTDDWDRVLDINLKSVFLMTRAVAALMRQNGGGSIVNVASDLAFSCIPNQAAYSASKAGIVAFTRTSGKEFAKDNIRVNCVCPGPVDTPLLDKYFSDCPDTEMAKKFTLQAIPMNRFAQPEEIANVILFLASDESSYITRAALIADGGAV